MVTRTLYYLLVDLNFDYELKNVGKPDNYYLLVIYFQESVFNFVIFYNLVLKQGNRQTHFNSQYKKATTTMIRNYRKITDEIKDDETSKKDATKTKTEDENYMQPNQQILDSRSIGFRSNHAAAESQPNTIE